MDRGKKSREKYREIFHKEPTQGKGKDPEFREILEKFVFGELWSLGTLEAKTRELISITVLTVIQTFPQLELHVNACLNVGCTPVEIREAIYQCAPFIGFPKTINAINVMNEVFESRGIQLPLEPQNTIKEEERFEAGLAIQEPIYGDEIKERYTWLPGEYAEALPKFLTEFCFGDFNTRNGLDGKTRELLTVVLLAAIGGAEVQVVSHVIGALKVGNTEEEIVGALVQAIPYMGIPKVFNALNASKEYLSKD